MIIPGIFIAILVFEPLLSIYFAFSSRKIPNWSKVFMLGFAYILFIYIGGLSGTFVLNNTTGILAIFPALNLIHIFLVTLLLRMHIIDLSSLVDDKISTNSVILNLIIILMLFLVLYFIFEMYWALIFSICLSYVFIIGEIVKHFFWEKVINSTNK